MKEKKLQKEKVAMRKNNIALNIVIILLLTTIIVSSVIGLYAWAKYSSAINGNATAQVAKWHFELKGDVTENTENTSMALTRTDGYEHVEEGKLAPGTYGELPITIDTKGTEVSLVYDLEVKITNYPKNMILENFEGQKIIPVISGEGTDDSPRVATIMVSKFVPYNTEDGNRLHNETITWNWPYQTGIGDSEINENDDIDTQDAGKEISVSISVTGTQVLEEALRFQIGKSVNLLTTLNGVELNDWKVLYKEGDYTYLILGDYLPNEAVKNIDEIETKGDYAVYNNTSRENFINAITTKTNWSSLLVGTINGKSYDYTESTADDKIYANGSPTLDLYVKSWNEKYPNNKLYTAGNNSTGYYIGTDEEPTTLRVGLSSVQGYQDNLYYPNKSIIDNEVYGCWLAAPSAVDNPHSMIYVHNGGGLTYTVCGNSRVAFRPIICLPSSILE